MARQLRILIADDHAAVRHAVALLINNQPNMSVVCEAADGMTVVQQAQELKPDVVVMDLSMPGMSGLLTVQALKKLDLDLAIVIWTRHDDDTHVHELLREGVSSYVSKRSPFDEIVHAIRAAAAGARYLDSIISERQRLAQKGHSQESRWTPLSESESEVLRMAAIGHSHKEIAAKLSVSTKTVELYKANGLRKLRLKGHPQLMRYASLHGWLDNL